MSLTHSCQCDLPRARILNQLHLPCRQILSPHPNFMIFSSNCIQSPRLHEKGVAASYSMSPNLGKMISNHIAKHRQTTQAYLWPKLFMISSISLSLVCLIAVCCLLQEWFARVTWRVTISWCRSPCWPLLLFLLLSWGPSFRESLCTASVTIAAETWLLCRGRRRSWPTPAVAPWAAWLSSVASLGIHSPRSQNLKLSSHLWCTMASWLPQAALPRC